MAQKKKPTKRTGTPHNKKGSTHKKAAASEPTEESGYGGRPLAPKAILSIMLVAVLAVGGFALYRHFSAASIPQEEESPKAEKVGGLKADDADRVNRLLSELTLEQKVAQLFIVTPESITGVDVAVAAGDTTREAITEHPVGGICYFAANLQTPEQTREMIRNSQNYSKDACGLPLFTCVEEEGGSAAQVAGNEAFDVQDVGDMSVIGVTGDTTKAQDAAYAIGSYLVDLGFNVDFAPVADIVMAEDEIIADRSFGSTPDEVASMVGAQVEGFSRAGILCAAKHFPGIGGAESDSHNGHLYSQQTAEEMKKWSIVPFEAAIQKNVPMIMVGHLSCLGIDGSKGDLPASLSPAVIGGILRDELGYDGLVVTDSLEMSAATKACDSDEQAVLAIKAGADLVLMPQDFDEAYKGLLDAVRSGDISESRIDESVRRIINAKLVVAG